MSITTLRPNTGCLRLLRPSGRFLRQDARATRFYSVCSSRSKSESTTFLPLVLSANNLLLSRGPYNSPNAIHKVRTRTIDPMLVKEEIAVPFFITEPSARKRPIGFLRPGVLEALREYQTDGQSSPWCFHYSANRNVEGPWAVSFAKWVNDGGSALRSLHVKNLVLGWKNAHMFDVILNGWTDEDYPVYYPNEEEAGPFERSPVAFSIERAALPLFSFANYGCLLTAFFTSPQTGETMLWIPQRSISKKTWPGAFDVTVGGGIGFGDTAISTIVRECAEEASLDPNFVRSNIRSVGILSFLNRSPSGWILPGLYHLFDLPLRNDGTPIPIVNPNDGEVERFQLISVSELRVQLLDGMFKPSSALALLEFLIRHGHLTDATDARYAEVCLRLRSEFILPVPWH
ncbi:hypothetical protein BD410DRAFT_791785 [Rickenella mellea]|uniref:Nudix hydrolase domain-containing protein n=1 Tax=Rickenella mellea TaxID=50990 RepID=A0A4Y7PXA2_9AGAM|nr:hypothetical protein BD410DRAFT_791785 [Rickenella mellea]